MPMKEICIVRVNGQCAAFGSFGNSPRHFYSFCPKGKFADWVQGIREDYPDFKLRCVRDRQIESWLRQRLLNGKNDSYSL